MSNTKILAVDLDDTLFADDKSVCEKNVDALNKMLDEGHVLAIDTGRPSHVIAKLLSPYPVFSRKNVYFLSFQGSNGYDAFEKKSLFGSYLDNDAAIDLLDWIKDSGLCAIAFEEGAIYCFGEDSNVEGYRRVAQEEVNVIKSAEELRGRNLVKIMAVNFDDHKALHDFEDAHLKQTNKYFNSMFSNVAFLEYVPKDSSKGHGLLKLADYLGVPHSNTVACGDERNDISMVTMAGVGCAVLNGRKELKEQANYITTLDNNQGAVAEVIEKFILN